MPTTSKIIDAPFLILDLGLDIVDRIHLNNHGLANQSLHKNLHCAVNQEPSVMVEISKWTLGCVCGWVEGGG
jgi:hypothetical protein